MQQPATVEEIAAQKQTIEALRGKLISGIQEKMTRQDGIMQTYITKTHTELHDNLEKKCKEIVSHVEELEKKMGEVKPGMAGASGASGDPWHGWTGGAAAGPDGGGTRRAGGEDPPLRIGARGRRARDPHLHRAHLHEVRLQREHGLGAVIDARCQEDVVEPLAQTVVEGVLLHQRIEQCRQCF